MTNERGFSLAELLVVVAVLALILTGVIALQQQGQIAYLMGSNRVETQQNARVAIALMTREIREACSLAANLTPGPPGDIKITVVDPTKASTVDCSSAAAGDVIQVEYKLGTGSLSATLLRLFANVGSALPAPTDCTGANAQYCVIGGVDSLTFAGYDMNNATPTNAAGTTCATAVVCSVTISIKTKSEESLATYAPGNVRAWLDSRVRLRNI
ncbi:MAG: prepilin-type N-terminal cleavage/methylation domain-containing protein [Candidatus Rokubacteria bacterium]|nr:prepilin-type N-terminal cleavage/methylation domain-containing protein [Candidatus Rokubacteria bacterium]